MPHTQIKQSEYNINKPNQNKRNTNQPNHKSNKHNSTKAKPTQTHNGDHDGKAPPVLPNNPQQ